MFKGWNIKGLACSSSMADVSMDLFWAAFILSNVNFVMTPSFCFKIVESILIIFLKRVYLA